MTNTITVKKRNSDNAAPTYLEEGELAATTLVGSKALYLGMSDNTVEKIGGGSASEISFDTTESGTSSNTVQDAIDTLFKQNEFIMVDFPSDANLTLTEEQTRYGNIIITDTSEYLNTTVRTVLFPNGGLSSFYFFNGTQKPLRVGDYYNNTIIHPGEVAHLLRSGSLVAPFPENRRQLTGRSVYNITSDADVFLSDEFSELKSITVTDSDDLLTTTRTIRYTTSSYKPFEQEEIGGGVLFNKTKGNVLTFTIVDGGLGYSPGTMIESQTARGLLFNIDSVDGSGTITSLSIVNAGYDYEVGDIVTINFDPGPTSLCSIEIDTVSTGQDLLVDYFNSPLIKVPVGQSRTFQANNRFGAELQVGAGSVHSELYVSPTLGKTISAEPNIQSVLDDIIKSQNGSTSIIFTTDADITLTPEQARNRFLGVIAGVGITAPRTIWFPDDILFNDVHIVNYTTRKIYVAIEGTTKLESLQPGELGTFNSVELDANIQNTSLTKRFNNFTTVDFPSDANMSLDINDSQYYHINFTDDAGALTTTRQVKLYRGFAYLPPRKQKFTNSTGRRIGVCFTFNVGVIYFDSGQTIEVDYDEVTDTLNIVSMSMDSIKQLRARNGSTSITLSSNNKGVYLDCTSNSPVTINVNTGLPTDYWCIIRQLGTGQITFAGTATVDNVDGHTKTKGQYAEVKISYHAPNKFILSGDTGV